MSVLAWHSGRPQPLLVNRQHNRVTAPRHQWPRPLRTDAPSIAGCRARSPLTSHSASASSLTPNRSICRQPASSLKRARGCVRVAPWSWFSTLMAKTTFCGLQSSGPTCTHSTRQYSEPPSTSINPQRCRNGSNLSTTQRHTPCRPEAADRRPEPVKITRIAHRSPACILGRLRAELFSAPCRLHRARHAGIPRPRCCVRRASSPGWTTTAATTAPTSGRRIKIPG